MNICSLLPRFGQYSPNGDNAKSLTEWTFFEALKIVAEKLGGGSWCLPCAEADIAELGYSIFDHPSIAWPQEDDPIWLIQYNKHMVGDRRYYEIIKEKWPNSKIVLFGSDVDAWNFLPGAYSGLIDQEAVEDQPWYNDYANEFNYDLNPLYDKYQTDGEVFFTGIRNVTWDVDLYIDPLTCMIHDASKRWTSKRITWNVSSNIAEQIMNAPKAASKDADAICMCAPAEQGTIRDSIFKHLDSKSFKTLRYLNEHNLETVVDLYSRSRVCLGTSSRAVDHLPRGSKGMRDWIAPLCGIPLIYDDYQEIVDMKIVPTYDYQDWNEIIDLTNSLTMDQELYDDIVKEQKKFSLENTLDKQLINIFNEVLF